MRLNHASGEVKKVVTSRESGVRLFRKIVIQELSMSLTSAVLFLMAVKNASKGVLNVRLTESDVNKLHLLCLHVVEKSIQTGVENLSFS